MNIRRGEIYLVNFGKKYNSEFGKIRPAVVIQNDVANRNIDKVAFKGVTLLPLTTSLCGGDLRVRISPREGLLHESEVCVNELCTLDLSRFGARLTQLGEEELREVAQKLARHLQLS